MGDDVVHVIDGVSDIVALFDANAETLRQAGAAALKRATEVRPGDVLGSGTCGTGCILELCQTHSPEQYPWLVFGDEVVATVERLGSLRNRVIPGRELVNLRTPS